MAKYILTGQYYKISLQFMMTIIILIINWLQRCGNLTRITAVGWVVGTAVSAAENMRKMISSLTFII